MAKKEELLKNEIQHIDISQHNVVDLVDAMATMAFSARDLHNAAKIYDTMLRDKDCSIILCLAGSLISAGLKQVFVDMIRNRMVDIIVSTGANIVDQDFFEAIGFRHYIAPERLKSGAEDDTLRQMRVDRIYDTLIDEDQLCACDDTVEEVASALEPRPYSSREFIREMGIYLEKKHPEYTDSIVRQAYEMDVPIFCPAFSDCSAGFGLLGHQVSKGEGPKVTIDSVKDFLELTQLKAASTETGIFMIGGGVPKNFTQDVTLSTEYLGKPAQMHRYAIQVTVADVRDGALSSSTLKEACSWGKVDMAHEQMVYSEATLAVPLIVGYAYHKESWKEREARHLNRCLETAASV